MTHTPWRTLEHNATIDNRSGETLRFVAICGPKRDIALIPVYDDQEVADEIARLIAAAPELLEALERMANEFENSGLPMTSLPGYAKAAIALATSPTNREDTANGSYQEKRKPTV